MSQQHAVEAKVADNMQGYVNKTAASIPMEVIISPYLAFVRESRILHPVFCPERQERHG